MTTVFGLAGLNASDFQYVRNVDQSLLYDGVASYVAMSNANRLAAANLFVAGQTSQVKGRNNNPMTGEMQLRSGLGNPDSVRRTSSYDIAFPLDDFGDEINLTDVAYAHMTPAEFQAHVDGIITRANNAYRKRILRRLFKNTNDTVIDPYFGTLTIKPIANGDGDLYPPVDGSDALATATHYIASGFVTGAISNVNNPVKLLVDKLEARWGSVTGGLEIAVLIHRDEKAAISALDEFVPYVPNNVIAGSNTDTVVANASIPGQIIGSINGAWVSVWNWMPSGYMTARYLGAEAPFMERVDLPETGLPSGLNMVHGPNAADFPMLFNTWRYRFGIGTKNRLSAAVLQLTAGGYTIPSAYQ